ASITLDALRDHGVEVPDEPGWKRMAKPEQLVDLFENAGLSNMQIERKSLGYYITPEQWWDIIWNAGFRGLVEQLGNKVEAFKQANIEAMHSHTDDKGLWLEIDVNYTWGVKP
ncbi:MAG: methyltransferase type 11, partial [Gammaproteobacteria bacterium]|nr:methyltransferase type 11 [Gammaproteobacteria bacterium]